MRLRRRPPSSENLAAAPPRPHMRVLRDADELAQAEQRAADGERRLRARLEARAARDAHTARARGGDAPMAPTLAQLRKGSLPPPVRFPVRSPVAKQAPGPEPSPHWPAA